MRTPFIDLFAGAGGLSEGFINAGFDPVAHVEIEANACDTLKTRAVYHYLKTKNQLDKYKNYLKGEISRDELYKDIPSSIMDSIINKPIGDDHNDEIHQRISKLLGKKTVDLIIGGPPCQAYSLVGRSRSKTKMVGDPRNYLFKQYANYLGTYNPKIFVFENVLGLKSANKGEYLKEMERVFDEKGYEITLYILDAKNFGVLQNRKRIIILGKQKGMNCEIPNLDKIRASQNHLVKDLLIDLPSLQSGEGAEKNMNYFTGPTDYLQKFSIRGDFEVLTQHITRQHNIQDKSIYKIAVEKWNLNKERLKYNDLPNNLKTHKNRTSFFDRFKVVASDLPYSQTVVAHIAKDGHYYIHPDSEQNRSISVREAARLQSFPDDYYFEGGRTAAFKQIGNAVPPLMAFSIAKEIKRVFFNMPKSFK